MVDRDDNNEMIIRFYEKSIIRVEIEEQRSILNSQWDETKKSIRDARQKINIQLTQEWTCIDN